MSRTGNQRRMAVLVAVVAVAFGAPLTGCTEASAPGAAAPAPSGGTGPAAPGAADPRLPLDPYQLSPPQWAQVTRAYRAFVAQCMRRFRLTSPEPTAAPEAPRTLNERRYGVADAAAATVAGYRLSPRDSPPKPTTGTPDPATLTVLTGDPKIGGTKAGTGTRPLIVNGERVPDGGCVGEARRRLNTGAPVVADMFLAQRLAQESYGRSEQDPRVRAVLRAWSDCMRARGFDYPTPMKAAADQRFAGKLSALEITTATADVACKRQTDLVAVWSTVEAEIQGRMLGANRPALERIKQANAAQLRVARDHGFG
ncbi:hypothetical protein WEI85_10455 [Actinomycetes bacterium KLBMP 9797]